MNKANLFVVSFIVAFGILLVAACSQPPELVEVTRVVVETVTEIREEPGEVVEVVVTRVVVDEVLVTREVPVAVDQASDFCCEDYRVAVLEEPTTLNFWDNAGGGTFWTALILAEQPGYLYTLSDQRFDFVPSLATGMPEGPVAEGEFQTFTVQMVEDATWSDGQPITAQDVTFTLSTCLDLQLLGNWINMCQPDVLDRVEAIDEFTVKYYFRETPGLSQWQYGVAQAAILPEHFWQGTVSQARELMAEQDEPDSPRPDGCDGEDLEAETRELCAEWDGYDQSLEAARQLLLAADPAGAPVAGDYLIETHEAGAFTHKSRNDGYYFQGAEILETDDGAWRQTLTDGAVRQHYGDGSGEETLRYVVGPYSDNVIYSQYGDQSAAFLALANGDVDRVFYPGALGQGLREQAEQGGDVVTYSNPDNSLFYLAFNLRKEPMSYPEFRQAVDILIDKEFVTNQVLQGSAFPVYAIVPPGNKVWSNGEIETPYVGISRAERLELAIQVLEEAGWTWDQKPQWEPDDVNAENLTNGSGLRMPNGELVPEIEIIGPGPSYDPFRATFNQWTSEWLRELGVPVESELAGFNTIIGPIFQELSYDMYILGWGLSIYPDYLCNLFHSDNDTATTGRFNNTGMSNPEYDERCDNFFAETDLAQAVATSHELQAMLAEERPYIPLFSTIQMDLLSRQVDLPYTDNLGGIPESATNVQIRSK